MRKNKTKQNEENLSSTKAETAEERDQTAHEEVANAITHGIGAVLSIACLCIAVVFAALRRDVWSVVSVSIYGVCMFILYLCSTLYHAVMSPRAKKVLNVFDHAAIYLLIAGSYTPICLAGMRHECPGWAWSIFGVVWLFAIVGIVFQSLFVNKYQMLSNATYLAMGWIALIAIYPLWKAMGTAAVLWIAAGGIAYSLGVIFYVMKRTKYMHAIWHLFVLAGTLIHYGVVLYYIVFGNGKQV